MGNHNDSTHVGTHATPPENGTDTSTIQNTAAPDDTHVTACDTSSRSVMRATPFNAASMSEDMTVSEDSPVVDPTGACTRVSQYLSKMKGQRDKPLPIPDLLSLTLMAIASFLSIGTLSLIEYLPSSAISSSDYTQVLGSFGASAILVYGLPNAPLSQPRNQIVGQCIAGLIGIACRLLIADNMGGNIILALPVSITLCILCMAVTQSFHPPAGGTNLIMVLSSTTSDIGFGMMVPVIYGTLVMLFWALVTCNLNPRVAFPKYWFGFKHILGIPFYKKSKPDMDVIAPSKASKSASKAEMGVDVRGLVAVEASTRIRACSCDCTCGAQEE
ncbi:hypothetical protein SARC_09849 [Sphaeroforma arctica JP610]|uniref:HPP transmembrane region domain-containing protein n=1 Tax=Sphaeroforma arctica JP610 TaxID=667725 RepID=A0A0L0FLR4_9EUKA|nr:hypothetical protein SARC_09849 [Sphaeroforma arctica JP610]KNC77695.1 hypothetical protein SARC_09849 [Sphaeroforma arctica JP610]|eukprot:XP_014151597.1 hypothetical protein SARC_09849 [Sphaeroforma arctica JP610]